MSTKVTHLISIPKPKEMIAHQFQIQSPSDLIEQINRTIEGH